VIEPGHLGSSHFVPVQKSGSSQTHCDETQEPRKEQLTLQKVPVFNKA